MMVATVAVSLPPVTAEETAAEPLRPARALLQEPECPANPLQHHLPQDASGLAVTRRGPLAPELHQLLSHPSATSPSSSSSAQAGAACSVSTAAPAASAGTAAATSTTATTTTSWQETLKEEQQRRTGELRALLQTTNKEVTKFSCRLCGQPKTRQYGHSRYGAEHYCAQVGGRSVEEWLQEKRAAGPPKVCLVLFFHGEIISFHHSTFIV